MAEYTIFEENVDLIVSVFSKRELAEILACKMHDNFIVHPLRFNKWVNKKELTELLKGNSDINDDI